MPFSSENNTLINTNKENVSFSEIQNTYNVAEEGYTHIPQQSLMQKNVHMESPYILPGNTNTSMQGSGIGSF